MKIVALSMLLSLSPLLASCPKPTPTDPGYDCANQPTYKKGEVVKVANAIAGEYIVRLKDRTNRMQPLMAVQGVTRVEKLEQGYAATIAKQALVKILEDPNVEVVFENGVKRVNPLPADATRSWGLDRIDQRDLPIDGQYTPGANGNGVNVAIVDTGRCLIPEEFGGRVSSDYFSAHGSPEDGHGHGCHVQGTVGALTWGVAKEATLYGVRVLDENGSGSDSDVIRGIEWVITRKKAFPQLPWVINMSLGGGDSPALNATTCDAIAAGITVVMAAGNENANADTSSPGRVRQGITVGASTQQDARADFSNYGILLDLFAPGQDIRSTQPGGGNWASFSGTSMASPHVAGGAALYLQKHPSATPAEVRDALVSKATLDKLTGVGANSPNALLFVREEE